MSTLIAISIPMENDVPADPPQQKLTISYHCHKETAAPIASFFPSLTADQLPDGEGWQLETLEVSTHNGTHVDAPLRYHSTMDGGARAMAIDAVPLDTCYQPGVKLGFRHFPDGYLVQPDNIETPSLSGSDMS